MSAPQLLGPNQRQTAADTPGISRNMQDPQPLGGGGDLNGSTAPRFFGHAGTGADRLSVPRRAGGFAGNYCGVI